MFSYSFDFILHDIFRSMVQRISQGGLHILCIDIDCCGLSLFSVGGINSGE